MKVFPKMIADNKMSSVVKKSSVVKMSSFTKKNSVDKMNYIAKVTRRLCLTLLWFAASTSFHKNS